MAKIKDELLQLDMDISNAIEKLEKMLDIKISDDQNVYTEITTNSKYLEFIANYVKEYGSSIFNDKDEVKKYLQEQAKEVNNGY